MTELNAQHPTPAPLVSQQEACRLLGGIDRTTLWRMVKRGELRRVLVGRCSKILRASIDQYIDRHTDGAADGA